jgi:hypothetical protein
MKQIGSAIQAEKSADLKLVLTATQAQAYEDMQAQQGERQGKGGGRGGKRGSRSHK